MRKANIIVSSLVVLTVAHVFVARYFRADSVLGAEYPPPYNVAVKERIGKQVAYLETLSVAEAVRHLSKMEYYFWPGAAIGAGTIFCLDDDGNYTAESLYEWNKIELRKILSNRVFRKSLQDLGKLPKNQASELLASELDATLSRYLELYDGFFETQSLDFNVGESIASLTGEIPDKQPVFEGIRNKLFALILIAGSLELTDIHEKIINIDSIAKGQVMEAYGINNSHVRGDYLFKAVLHNNLIQASGLYGTSSRKEDAALKSFAGRFVSHKLVDFSAPATEYDVLVRDGFQKPTPDKGYINVRYFDQMTYKDLDELRRILDSP